MYIYLYTFFIFFSHKKGLGFQEFRSQQNPASSLVDRRPLRVSQQQDEVCQRAGRVYLTGHHRTLLGQTRESSPGWERKNNRTHHLSCISFQLYIFFSDQVDFSTHGNDQRRGVIDDYKFYLAFEEISCRDYITNVFFAISSKQNIVPIGKFESACIFWKKKPTSH